MKYQIDGLCIWFQLEYPKGSDCNMIHSWYFEYILEWLDYSNALYDAMEPE